MDDRQRRENDLFWRGEEARLRREREAFKASPYGQKRYPEVGDPPPGKIKFAFAMAGFIVVVITAIVMCGALVWMLTDVF